MTDWSNEHSGDPIGDILRAIEKIRKEDRLSDDQNDNPEEEFNPEDFFGGQEAIVQMGQMGLTVFRAVLRDGGTWNEAFAVTGAWFAGMSKGMATDD